MKSNTQQKTALQNAKILSKKIFKYGKSACSDTTNFSLVYAKFRHPRKKKADKDLAVSRWKCRERGPK
jgi:hypothetical protein